MVIRLVSIQSEVREAITLPAWGSRVCFDEYTPPFWDSVGGEVVAGLAAMLSALPGHEVASPIPLSTMMLQVRPSLGVGLSRSWLPAPEYASRDALGDRVLPGPPAGRC